MNNIKIIALSFFVLATVVVGSGLTRGTTSCQETEDILKQENNQNQTINLFVTHGHCSTPFAGNVENLKVVTTERQDQGNPLEDMEISFEIDPNSFNVCASDDLTARIKTPGLFIGENDEKITFKSKEVYTVGLDWYQVNGQLSIKGVVKEMKIFATGIRDPKEAKPSFLVLEGQLNLFDWGIDYDKMVNGTSDPVPTTWMYLNMKINMS